jgi:lipid A 3-O-deacylase
MLLAKNPHILSPLLFLLFVVHIQASLACGAEQELNGRKGFITKGKMDIQLASGPLFSTKIFGNGTPTTNAWQSSLPLGWILNNPKEKGSVLGGSFEAIIEVPYALIYQGPGTYWVGITGLLRYNFVPPDSKWIPYVQAGAGVVHTNAYKDNSQDAIGQATEFTPQASLGIRYFLKEKWAVNLEAIFLHISNGGLADRNTGLNFFGGFIGVTYLFDPSRLTK